MVLFCAIALIGLSAFFTWYVNRPEENVTRDNLVVDTGAVGRRVRQIDENSKLEQPEWMQDFIKGKNDLRLPANESLIVWDLVDPKFRLNTVLVLRLSKPDKYEKICIEQFFISRAIEHTVQEGDFFDVRLKTKERAAAEQIIVDLATYDLSAELIVLNEPKPY
ncbi:MAG: hypothetical protein LBN32_03460 [Helicobacteraceae bacterium]|nr:hypothetical protein [Helicobacteraceae bacterium]